jgi:hypothetical protein
MLSVDLHGPDELPGSPQARLGQIDGDHARHHHRTA